MLPHFGDPKSGIKLKQILQDWWFVVDNSTYATAVHQVVTHKWHGWFEWRTHVCSKVLTGSIKVSAYTHMSRTRWTYKIVNNRGFSGHIKVIDEYIHDTHRVKFIVLYWWNNVQKTTLRFGATLLSVLDCRRGCFLSMQGDGILKLIWRKNRNDANLNLICK